MAEQPNPFFELCVAIRLEQDFQHDVKCRGHGFHLQDGWRWAHYTNREDYILFWCPLMWEYWMCERDNKL